MVYFGVGQNKFTGARFEPTTVRFNMLALYQLSYLALYVGSLPMEDKLSW